MCCRQRLCRKTCKNAYPGSWKQRKWSRGWYTLLLHCILMMQLCSARRINTGDSHESGRITVCCIYNPYEKESHVKSSKYCKFFLHIYELTEPVQRKKWMTLRTWYVFGETMDVRTELLCLLLLDTTDTTKKGLFKEMQQYLIKFQILFENILALSTGNAAVMVGNENSFYVPPARKLVFSLQIRVTQCCVLRYRGMKCKNWTAHALLQHATTTQDR